MRATTSTHAGTNKKLSQTHTTNRPPALPPRATTHNNALQNSDGDERSHAVSFRLYGLGLDVELSLPLRPRRPLAFPHRHTQANTHTRPTQPTRSEGVPIKERAEEGCMLRDDGCVHVSVGGASGSRGRRHRTPELYLCIVVVVD
jgi:hypothetical protein